MTKGVKTRICFLMQEGKMAGVEYNAVTLAGAMNQDRVEVVFVLPYEGTLAGVCRKKKFRYAVVSRPPLFSTALRIGSCHILNPLATLYNLVCFYWHSGKLAGVFQREGFSLIVTKGLMANFYGSLAALKAKIPCVWDMQDVVNTKRGFGVFRIVLNGWARVFGVNIIAGSNALASQFSTVLHSKGRMVVQYNGVDVNAYHPNVNGKRIRKEWGVKDDEILIGHCARFAYWKGQLDFIEAASRLTVERDKLKFVLVGSAVLGDEYFERKINERISQLGLKDKFILPGFRKDLPHALAAMDCFVHSSTKGEGCPLTVILALASGTPTVATNVTGTNEIIEDGISGLLVPPAQPQAIAGAISHVLSDNTLRRRISQNGRERAVVKFSLDAYGKNCQEFFESLVHKREKSGLPKILFVHGGLKTFVKDNRDSIKRHFELSEVEAYRLDWKTLLRLIRLVRRAGLVYCYFAGRHAIVPVFLAKCLGKKLIIVAAGWDVVSLREIDYGAMRGGWKTWLVRWMFKQADRVVCVSKSNFEEAMQNARIPKERISLAYHGFTPNNGAPLMEKSEDMVLTVGEITHSNLRRKGLETFVRSAAAVPEAKFVLAGNWSDDAIDILKAIATSNVTFTGFLKEDELNRLMALAKVYVQVSYHEAFGCSLAEAMLMRCIPVVTDRFALPEVVGSTGHHVPYGDVRATAGAIRTALAVGPEYAEKARQRVLEHFSASKHEAAICAIIREVWNEKSGNCKAA